MSDLSSPSTQTLSNISPFNPGQLKCLELLATGITPEQCGAALGISVALISQYCSEEQFAAELARRRFEGLRKHNARDAELDSLEDYLIAQLKKLAPLAMRPMEAARLFSIVNAAKRRGQSAPESIHRHEEVIRLTIPVQIINRFSVNTNNQVISTGHETTRQDLITIQSGQMHTLLAQTESERLNEQLRLPASGQISPITRTKTPVSITEFNDFGF